MIKPYCSYILYNIYIINSKANNLSYIKEKSLGNLVNEIIQNKYLIDIFKPTVYTLSGEKNIRLNTLRNIGAHNDYMVTEGKIICDIRNGKNEITEQFKLRREGLHKILIDVTEAFRALKLGYTIFFIDNLDYINKSNIIIQHPMKEQLILNTFFGLKSKYLILLNL